MGWLERAAKAAAVAALVAVTACDTADGAKIGDTTEEIGRRHRRNNVTATTEIDALATSQLTAQPGGQITLGMRWKAQPMPADYEVFVHFVDANGKQLPFGGDHAPPTPTSKWSGAIAYDHTVNIPADVPPGMYTIRAGLYELTPPYDHRIALATGTGVTADEQTRYTIGTLEVGDGGGSTPTPTDPGTPSTPSSPGTVAGPAGQNAADYTLAFDEEFDSFDASLWNDHVWYEQPNPTQNFTVENGMLKIWPQRDASGNFFNRTIDTDGHYYQTYGFFEMEARLPVGRGTWPAFWIFNHIDDRRPEIDIMEAYPGGDGWGADSNGQRIPVAYGATIWLDLGVRAGFDMISTPDLSAGMHKYGVKWEPNKQTFYFDGSAVFSQDVSMPDPMYIILDLWFGSASGTPDGSTPTGKSNSYEVNYVRAWQFR